MIFNVLMYAMMIYMIIRIITMNGIRKKNNYISDLMQSVSDSAVFNEKADRLEETYAKDTQFINEINVFRLWEQALNERYVVFQKTVEGLDLTKLVRNTNKGRTIEEVPFFYLLQTIPNILYGNHNEEMRLLLKKKTDEVKDLISDQMTYQISEANAAMYAGEEDKAVSVYENILNGDYEEMKYARNMIGIYKKVCAAMLTKYYQDRDPAKAEELKEDVKYFYEMNIGKRWLKNIGVEVPEPVEETAEEDTAEEEPQETDGEENKE